MCGSTSFKSRTTIPLKNARSVRPKKLAHKIVQAAKRLRELPLSRCKENRASQRKIRRLTANNSAENFTAKYVPALRLLPSFGVRIYARTAASLARRRNSCSCDRSPQIITTRHLSPVIKDEPRRTCDIKTVSWDQCLPSERGAPIERAARFRIEFAKAVGASAKIVRGLRLAPVHRTRVNPADPRVCRRYFLSDCTRVRDWRSAPRILRARFVAARCNTLGVA